jgi:hypothetical protein
MKVFAVVVSFFRKARKVPALATALGPTLPRVVCAWCNGVLRDGAEPVSHGICELCAAVFFPRRPIQPRTDATPCASSSPE